ncbi:MAG: hypothetical protein PGN09_07725 [Sphingomonas fennica]
MRSMAVGLMLHATAAAAATDRALAPAQPTTISPLGYTFEVGPMIAGLCACAAVRFYVAKTEAEHRWTVDLPVTGLALMFTAAALIGHRPEPLAALMWGTGFGALGAGIIKIALAWVKRSSGMFEPADETPRQRVRPAEDDRDAIDAAVRRLDAED